MFNNSPSRPLVHLSRPASRTPETNHLPRGECRYILPADADGARQRCSCASFNINDTVPGTQCGCGHQAWHHVQSPSGDFVPVEEHLQLVDRFKKLEESQKALQRELEKERKAREKLASDMSVMIRGSYGNMAFLRYYLDEKLEFSRITFEDKIEGALDRSSDALSEVDKIKVRVTDLDEACMRLEERVDLGRFPSRSLTPLLENKTLSKSPAIAVATLPMRSRSQEKISESWDARLILVPKKTQHYAFPPDSKAYARCQSRGLHQDLHFEDKDSESFNKTTDGAFGSILRSRPWMPLQCLNSSDMSLGQLNLDQRNPALWSYAFLESQCMANDKAQGDVIYVALMHEELGWPDIYNLPPLFGFTDNTCWEIDEELDGKALNARMEYKMDMDVSRVKSLETDSMYEYSPPPYSSSRTHSDANRLPSALDVLAGTALAERHRTPSMSERSSARSFHSERGGAAPSISDRSTFSDRSIDSTIFEEEDDEHRDKRTKHGALRPQPQSGLIPSLPSPPQQKMYYSGRAKRKINPAKQKEPLDWRVSEMKISNPMKGILHRRHTDTGSKDEQQPSSDRVQQEPSTSTSTS